MLFAVRLQLVLGDQVLAVLEIGTSGIRIIYRLNFAKILSR